MGPQVPRIWAPGIAQTLSERFLFVLDIYYDGNCLRVVKSISGGTTTVSIYSGSQIIAEYDNGAAPSAPSREYIYNPAGGAKTGLLAMISGGATTYYHQDHLSVRLTTNGSGSVVTQEGTYPFGELWYPTGAGNKWFFTSYDRDSESGLDYALARYYDSRTGTFCSADPLAGHPSDPQSWNRYPYGRNDPIMITDPTGEHWWDWLALGGALVADYFTFGAASAAIAGLEAGTVPGINAGIAVTTAAASAAGTANAASRVWHDSFSVPYGGLTNGIQTASGLPTMADAVNPAMDQTQAGPADSPNWNQNYQNYPPWLFRKSVLDYLKSDSDCLHWLNSGGGNAYQLMSNVEIRSGPSSGPGWTFGSPGNPLPIFVGSEGPFYARNGGGVTGAPFEAGT